MKKSLFVLLFAMMLLIVLSASAQDVCVRDSFFPDAGNCGYDVQDYQMDIAWNLEGDTWDVSEVLTFISEWDTDELWFDFTDEYEVSALSINGIDADYDRQETKLIVHYNFSHDTEYKMYAAFSGKLDWGELFDPDGSSRIPENGFCLLNEPVNARRYYICNDHPKDKATYHYSFTVPANYVPAGSGRLLMIEEANETVILPGKSYERNWDPDSAAENGTVTFTYAQEALTAPYLFTICAGAFDMKLQTTDDGKKQLDFVDHDHPDTETAWQMADMQEEIIAALEAYFGDYPYEDLGAIIAKTQLSMALETQGRSLYDASTTTERIFAHEITHQWLGDLISLEDWSDLWLKEGAATYGEALWKLHKDGVDAYNETIRGNYETIANGETYSMKTSDDSFAYLRRFFNIPEDDTLYIREKAVKAAAAVCRIPAEQVTMKGSDVTFTEWCEGTKASCGTIYLNARVFPYFSDMLGSDMSDKLHDHFSGPKEIEWKNYFELYGYPAYDGGSIVYYALHQKLGDELFKQGLQTLIAENKWGTVNEEKFIDVFSRVSGEDLSDYIKSYLYYGEDGHIPDLPGIETWEEARARFDVK